MQQWFDEYAVSHQHKTNIAIHFVCVPLIFFSIVGMVLSIPADFPQSVLGLNLPMIENWATVAIVFLMIFYIRLSLKVFLQMLFFSALCLAGNYFLGQFLPLFYTSLTIFVLAWVGQFYGHKLEGAKPSFFKDLQFLLIGPPWVLRKMLH